MHAEIGSMVQDFEQGKLTRRQLVTHLAALTAAAAGMGKVASAEEAQASTFTATGLNHIALDVTDVARSRDFYVKHLGMQISRDSESSCFLTCDKHFVALFRREKPGMNHYCYSIKDYNVDRAEETLKANDLKPRRSGNRIYFDDPDGLEVQLAAENHRP
jgi:catechol-2,3-dioxygenase